MLQGETQPTHSQFILYKEGFRSIKQQPGFI